MRVLALVLTSMISCGGVYFDSAKCTQTCDGQPAPDYNLRVRCSEEPDHVVSEVAAQCASRFRADCSNPVCGHCVAYLSVTNDCPH